MIHWVWQNRRRAGATTETFPKAKRLYFAICTWQQVYGVIGILIEKQTQPDAFTSSILFSILGECALTLESLRNADEKEKAAVLAKNEQLRANLLRSISHDPVSYTHLASSPRIIRLSPGSIRKIFLAFAGITICPLSPTFTMPKMCFPFGGTPTPNSFSSFS